MPPSRRAGFAHAPAASPDSTLDCFFFMKDLLRGYSRYRSMNSPVPHGTKLIQAPRDELLRGVQMSPANIFSLQLVLGYVAWLLCYRVYIWPRLKSMDRVEAQRAIATLHSFRFFGLAFVVPGVVGSHLPGRLCCLRRVRRFGNRRARHSRAAHRQARPLFWLFVVAFNVVGAADLLLNYYHAVQANLPAVAGELGATYVIPIIYVPLLMITHFAAFYMLMRPAARPALA